MSSYPKGIDQGKPLKVGLLGNGQVVRMAYYVPNSSVMHEFRTKVCGSSHLAIKFVATSGPMALPSEHFFWIPKSWELHPVPRNAGLYYIPAKKVSEIGASRVLSFN